MFFSFCWGFGKIIRQASGTGGCCVTACCRSQLLFLSPDP